MNRHFSYWETKHFWKGKTHVIAGSGITGLTSAIYLAKSRPDAKILILERGILPSGASTRNAGFACFGSASEILDNLKQTSESDVFNLVEMRFKGLGLLRGLLTDVQLGYAHTGGFEIFRDSEEEIYLHCLGALGYLNAELVNAIGRQAFWDASAQVESTGMQGVSYMIVNREEGMVDTGLMMKSLAALARSLDVEILCGVEVKGFEDHGNGVRISTSAGELDAKAFLIATNGFARELLPGEDVQPCRAQVMVTNVIDGLQLKSCFHHDRGYNYFRNVDGRVLLGGGRHTSMETENTDSQEVTDSIQEYLEELLRHTILPGIPFRIEQRWAGTMGMGRDKGLILKKLSDHVACAVRFGGMGVALGSYAGQKAARLMADI